MQTIAELTPTERLALDRFQRQHGARVRRTTAMQLLNIDDDAVFRKVLDAHPDLRHRLAGEGQDKYVTAVIFLLLPPSARCAIRGEEP